MTKHSEAATETEDETETEEVPSILYPAAWTLKKTTTAVTITTTRTRHRFSPRMLPTEKLSVEFSYKFRAGAADQLIERPTEKPG